ncbi:MAG: glycosyltransferase family 4 protein [Thermoplasmata archaeon]
MQIAQLSTRYPPGPGGVERHVGEISPRLGDRGHTVRVLTSDLRREFPWERLPRAVPRREATAFGSIERLPAWSLPGALHYPFLPRMSRALERSGAEIVHVHTYGTYQVAVADRHRRRHGVPYLLATHFHPETSMHGGGARRRLRHFYDLRVGGPMLAHAARLLVESREEERLLRRLGRPLPPVRVVPPGYTPLPAAPPPGTFARRYGIPGPYVLFVGRLAPNKGLRELVEAFAALAREDPEVSLVLIGDDGGVETEIVRQARARGLERRIFRTGFLADEALLAGALRDAGLFVLPSEYEAFGLVLLEAMAQGTPVLSTRVGGIPEFVEEGKAGRLVPPHDDRALAEALRVLWSDPEGRRRMGAYGRDSVVPRYTWEALVDALEAIYLEILDGRSAPTPRPSNSSA